MLTRVSCLSPVCRHPWRRIQDGSGLGAGADRGKQFLPSALAVASRERQMDAHSGEVRLMTPRHSHIVILLMLVIFVEGCGQRTAKTEEPAAPPPTVTALPAEQPTPQQQRPAAEPPTGRAPSSVAASPSPTQPAPAAPRPPQSVDEFTAELAL